ncbi:MAG: hypothetical protein AB7O73_12175 [Bacteroidia bacterium]
MAIYGIGAYYGTTDVSDSFIAKGLAYVGWNKSEAPSLHEILRYIKIGDMVYIKSAPIGQGLRVKAVGIVIDNELITDNDLGVGIKINWLWTGHEILDEIDDKNNVRNNTLYEEYSKHVQLQIINLLTKKIQLK